MKAIVATWLLLAAATGPAAANVEPGKEGNLAEFVKPAPGERVCFARRYDAAHLAKHPKQTVTAIGFFLTYFRHEPDESHKQGQRNYYFKLEVGFRDRPGQTFTTGGDCIPGKGAIHCHVDCDGGGVNVQWRKKPETILIDMEGTGRIRLQACGEESDGVELEPGADDRSFLLTRMKDAECPEHEKW